MNEKRTRRIKLHQALAVVGAALAVTSSLFAFGAFTDTEKAARAVAVGQEGFRITPAEHELDDGDPETVTNRFTIAQNPDHCPDGNCTEPQVDDPCGDDPTASCAHFTAAGAPTELRLTLDIPEIDNDGEWIQSIDLDLTGSTPTSPPSLLDGDAYSIYLLACPSTTTQQGEVEGTGPYTCSTGDFAVVPHTNGHSNNRASVDSIFRFTPETVGAVANLTDWSTTFASGNRIELVACLDRTLDSLTDGSYAQQQTSLIFGGTSFIRDGMPLPQPSQEAVTQAPVTASGCAAAISLDHIFPEG